VNLSGNAVLAGVIGWPVRHSLSPRLHGFWLAELGIDGAYVPLAVRPEDFDQALRALPKLGFRGANVTVPHKQAAFAAVDEKSAVAERLGAVNTVVVGADGRLLGDNTDGYGFMQNLAVGAPGLDVKGKLVTVLGAGGAARAIVAALTDAGAAEVRIVNRTRERAEAMAQDLGGPIEPLPWDHLRSAFADTALVVNTTSLGMAGHDPLALDLSQLPPAAVVTDIVYNPLETQLLAAARAHGNVVVDGLGMLLHQARPGFEAWFGKAPEVSAALRRHVETGSPR
jgi:shikimate dehydrogenase